MRSGLSVSPKRGMHRHNVPVHTPLWECLAPGLQLQPEQLHCEHRSTDQDTDYLPTGLDAMIDLADAVERAG